MTPIWKGSRHFSRGRRGYRPEAVIVHVMEGSLVGADGCFNDPAGKVSAHYAVGCDGTIHQYVRESDQAWHAGRSWDPSWSGCRDGVNPNLYTIGIEHEAAAAGEWPRQMVEASATLIKEVCLRWNIAIDRHHIVGHAEICVRRACPGSRTDVEELVKRAADIALDPGRHNLVRRTGEVAVQEATHAHAAPTTAAARVASFADGEMRAYTGWTSSGQAVDGNSHWYRDREGRYFWAGATERPLPGL